MQNKKLKKVGSHLVCVVVGMVLFYLLSFPLAVLSWFFIGFEIQSKRSFPTYHLATLYTRAGIGDQNYSLDVDGRTVWMSGDAPGGDNKEEIIWDETGHVVTLKLRGEKAVIYDVMNKEVKHKGW
jgi:hypothetical protein